MHWYEGGISDAVTLTKQKGAIFVVYIEGDDGKSKHITDLINSDEITKLLESEHFVAIKLEGNSVPHQQFNEIYKDTTVPSIYFIGKNGTPLDIIRDVEDKEKLAQKVGSILQKAGISIAARSEDLIKSEQGSSSPSPPDGVVCENGVCTIKKQKPSPDKSEPTPPVGDSSPILTEEEKLNRAKDVLKKQRELKQKEEEEKERQQEIERRKMGQSVQNLKRWQQDEELKQLKEEREKEKRLNQEARDRVLAQIAQDKAERASKFSPPSQSQPEKPKEGSPATAQPSTSSGKQQSNEARLQFKLPDGSSHTHEFPSADSLQSVVDYIKMNLNLSFNNFTLSTTFPRREFTTNDYSQSLRDLLLVPNAVILVLPIGGHGAVTTNPGGSGLGNFIWYLVAPLWGIFQYLKGLVFGEGSGAASSGVKREAGSSYSASSRNTVLNVSSKYDLENKLKNARSKLVVIDFFATWCGPCRMIAPKLEELAREFPNVVFLKVDVDDNRDISSSYGVRAMPTFVFVKNSKNVTSFSGADYYKIRDTILRFK